MSGIRENEHGAVSIQGVITLIIVVVVIWIVISLLPVIQLPDELETAVEKTCKDWLRQSVPKRRPTIPGFTSEIRGVVKDLLKNHVYDKKELLIDFIDLQHVRVSLPYTMKINILGFDLDFKKELDIDVTAISF